MRRGRENLPEFNQLNPYSKEERKAYQKEMADSASLPKEYMSFSQIDMYLRCPRQYYHRYVLGQPRPPGVALLFGKGVHAAVEKTHHHLIDYSKPAPIEMLKDTLSDKFDEMAEEFDEINWEEEEHSPGELKDTGIKMVSLYNEKFAPKVKPQVKKTPGGVIKGVEKKIETTVAGINFIGYIDLIDCNATAVFTEEETKLYEANGGEIPEDFRTAIVDFKTKQKAMAPAEVMNSLQLTLYSYVEQVPIVRFDQFLNQKKGVKFIQSYSSRKQEDYFWLEEIVTHVVKSVSAGMFPPCSPTEWMCTPKWCGYYSSCRGKKL